MSLFKEPFDEKIVLQLDKRQEIFGKNIRSPQDIAYLNSKQKEDNDRFIKLEKRISHLEEENYQLKKQLNQDKKNEK